MSSLPPPSITSIQRQLIITMRAFIIAFICCISVVSVPGQSLIRQAQELRQTLTIIEDGRRAKLPSLPSQREKARQLLRNYFVIQDCDHNTNPYINCSDTAWIKLGENFQEGALAKLTDSGFVPNIPVGAGASVTSIADGLARFLVKRTKEELSVAFFRKFKNRLEHDDYMRLLFPFTRSVLSTIDNQIYYYQAYLGALRSAFDQDMKALPLHLQATFQDKHIIKDDLSSLLVEDLLGAAQLQMGGQPAPDFFKYFAEEANIQDASRVVALGAKSGPVHDLAEGLQLAYLLSESLRSDNNAVGNPWMSKTEVRKLLNDPVTFHLYLGLLWQNSENIAFSNGNTLREMLASIANVEKKKESIRQELLRLSDYGAEISRGLDSVLAQVEGKLTYDKYFPAINGSLRILEQGIRFRHLFDSDTIGSQLGRDWITQLQHFEDLSFYVHQRSYVNAIIQVISIVDYFCKDNVPRKDLLKYGTFIASIAEAQSAEAVEQAITLFALPPGGSSLKKQSPLSISLNAYTGLSYGRERLTNVSTVKQDANVGSVTAPVGLAFNMGMKKAGCITLFTSVIDVGALTAYRFNDPNSNDLPELKWSNIVAPGVFLIYGAPFYLPLSVGAGIQSGPNLRNVNDPIQTTRAIRGIIFANVDIPITYFYH